jgi:hypothetical protein
MRKSYFYVMSVVQVEAEDEKDAEKIYRTHLASGEGDVTVQEAKLCWIRQDIRKHRYAVPVGDGYYEKHDPLHYRWINDDNTFQVYLDCRWQDAYSGDFDFEYKE